MNDYYLNTADWEQLASRFENQNLASRFGELAAEGDWDTLSSIAMDFLSPFFWGDDAPDGEPDPPDPVHGPFGVWGELGVLYGDLRSFLPEAERREFDSVWQPFVGPLAGTGDPPGHPFELPAAMKPLRQGGLVLAMAPATCRSLQNAARRCTLDALLETLSARPAPPPIPGAFPSGLSGLFAESPPPKTLARLDNLRRASSDWLTLILRASRNSRGILGIYEI